MPQMMPINWMFSFVLFIIIFLVFNIMNYYIFNFNINKSNNNFFNKKTKNFLWKW